MLVARAIVRVAKESVDRLAVHAAMADEMVKRGVRNPIEVPRTQAELAKARGRLIAADNEERVARVVLDNAIGERTAGKYELADDRTEWRVLGSLPDFVDIALRLRPELAELRGRVDANLGRLEEARGGYFPTLSATASANLRGVGGFGNWFNYDAGLVLTWPIFEGYLYQKTTEATKATKTSAIRSFP